MTDPKAFQPDWVSPPGDTIADALEELGMSQVELAQRTGFTKKHINDLIKGKVAITASAALRLEAVLGEPASFWLQREANYREALARRAARDEASASRAWLRELPRRWMEEEGWVRKLVHAEEQVQEYLRYFGVASVSVWREIYEHPLVAFRAPAKAEKRVGAIAAWLRQIELRAGRLDCMAYDRQAFTNALPLLRHLTTEPNPEVFVPEVQRVCAACGVAVVFVPAPKGCPLHGATRWFTPQRAILALTLRYKTNDQLWFSFFHEAAHILKHGKKILFAEGAKGLEGLDPRLEAEADRFAADLLIPRSALDELAILRTKAGVTDLARRLGVAPGILVGRMQKEGWLPWTHLNGLKVRYTWAKR